MGFHRQNYTVFGILMILSFIARPTWAYDLYPTNVPPTVPPASQPELNTFNVISAPISEFVQTLQNIGVQANQSVSNIPQGGLNPASFYTQVDDWVTHTVGTNISGVLREIGTFLIWIINIIVALLNFISSLIRGALGYQI